VPQHPEPARREHLDREDPCEIQLPGVNQVNVNDKAGLTFSAALKSFLRQDPDIIMVGEIRDLETADIAIKAAQTGHLVLSTLHTNDAPTTLTRMLNMAWRRSTSRHRSS
jgi:type IV pilus assembly protein PilB